MPAVPIGYAPYDTTSLVPLRGGRLVSAGGWRFSGYLHPWEVPPPAA